MYSFEGNFKKRPIQSLGGSSRHEDKLSLLRRAQEERHKREEQRKRQQSCVHIQSYYRSSITRQNVKEIFRKQYSDTLQRIQHGDIQLDSGQMLADLLRPLLFFYNHNTDTQHLTSYCSLIMKQQKEFIRHFCTTPSPDTYYQLRKLLMLCCKYIESIASSTAALVPTLRVLTILTDASSYSEQAASTVINKLFASNFIDNWYSMCRSLLDHRVPSQLDEDTLAPPTPVASTVLDLIYRPVHVAVATANQQTCDAILQSFSRHLLCEAFTPQLYHYILPNLVSDEGIAFPFHQLLRALVPAAAASIECEAGAGATWNIVGHTKPQLAVPTTLWLLCAVLKLAQKYIESLKEDDLQKYLLVLYSLVGELHVAKSGSGFDSDEEGDEDDSGDESDPQADYMDTESYTAGGIPLVCMSRVHNECLKLLDTLQHVRGIIRTLGSAPGVATITAVCTVCHTLLVRSKLHIHNTRLLYSLAFNPTFLKNLWVACVSVNTEILTGSNASLLLMLSRGINMSNSALSRIVPLLSVFCTLFSHSLITLHDTEFHGKEAHANKESAWRMPFTIQELIPMSRALRDACLGIIELAHPESKPALRNDYRAAFLSVSAGQETHTGAALTLEELHAQRNTWAGLFKAIVQLVRQLFERDSRQRFCPEGHWLSNQVSIQADKPSQLYKSPNAFERRKFGQLSTLNPSRNDDLDLPPLSTMEARNLTILTEIPFVVSFAERVKIFSRLVAQDRKEHQGEMRYLTDNGAIRIVIRRNYLYEDAFEKLSVENEPNLKLLLQVQLVNFAGLDEAGIDGGGLFREFLWELLKTAFDPNRGFFRTTTDRLLYPNPQVRLLFDNFADHYFFLGRMLGKALYEGMLVELPFASFFFSKLLSRRGGDVDIHHLASLDPEMYKNLLFLKDYTGDVRELELDFTVMNNDFGEANVVELKPGGADIPVDNNNRIEYIHRMAHFRLNRQIRAQCDAFRRGLADVINLEWLHMFDHRELQVLISGAQVPIDIDDLRRYTNYSGGYTEGHPVILSFWSAVNSFTDVQKQALLKFVTSCSRPPLLGFKELYPAFCIHYGGKEERLPTASTCMNLLKLPEFKNQETLTEKLLYAIESGTGFELS